MDAIRVTCSFVGISGLVGFSWSATLIGAPCVSKDIKNILRDWDYDPDGLSVRIITGDDGRDKIQLRIDMGLLQMEFNARPDGRQIHGHETWLKKFEHQQKEQTQANPDGTPFELSTEDCDLLLSEGVQFYHRYLSFWHLELFDLCARDTLRNLRLFSFVRKYAKNKADKLRFDQWRPYVLMMHARSLSAPLVRSEDYTGALQAIDSGIAAINSFLEEYDHSSKADHLPELLELRGIRAEVIRLL